MCYTGTRQAEGFFMNWIYYVLLALALLGDVLLVVLLVRTRQSARRTDTAEDFVRAMTPVLQEETDLLAEQLRAMQGETARATSASLRDFSALLGENQRQSAAASAARLEAIDRAGAARQKAANDALLAQLTMLENRLKNLEDSNAGYTSLAAVRIALSAVKRDHPEYGSLILSLENVEDADWENNWKAFYKPMEIGDRLIVIPDWEEAEAGDRVALRLNPGLIFGTGSHATTRMCLELLEGLDCGGARALDLGCGSGILGIGALILGCESCTGCDIDPKSPAAAADNAAINGIAPERYHMYVGDVLSDRRLRARLGTGYDIVLANIVADVIIPLAPYARECTAENGYFITSGIIDGREDEVISAVQAAGFEIRTHLTQESWHALLCQPG